MLQCTVAKLPASEQLFVCSDWNGHIGFQSTGYEEVHGGQTIEKRNTEGERVLEFAFANELVVGNTWFKKKPEHLSVWECCYPDRLYPVTAEFSETGVQRKGYTWGGDCNTT